MPVTLEQAKRGVNTPFERAVYDEFRRGSLLMDALVYDNAVSPGTGGSNLTYGYTQLKSPAVAQFRDINQEYTPDEAERDTKTTKLKILGGSYQIDRVIQDTSAMVNEASFQATQKIKGAINLFHNTIINGDEATDPLAFDGLNKMLTGTTTEIGIDRVLDTNNTDDKWALIEALDEFLSELDGAPTMLMGNKRLITKIQAAARRAGYYTRSEDAFGRKIGGYDGIPIVDLGYFASKTGEGEVSTNPVVPLLSREISGEEVSGLTDLYAVNIGIDGFHGVTTTGNNAGVRSYLPDFNSPGVVKTGDVEMVAGIALKQTRKAGVLRNIKV